jgi:hypothetical protein
MDSRLNEPSWLSEQYAQHSLQAIADTLGVSRNTVRNRLIQFGITRRTHGAHFKGQPKPPDQRAKMSAARHAYWEAHPDRTEHAVKVSQAKRRRYDARPYYVTAHSPASPYRKRREHRLVMEGILGRSLTPDEVVHHVNHIKGDNRPENLVIMSRREHIGLHSRQWHQAHPEARQRPRDASGRFQRKASQ